MFGTLNRSLVALVATFSFAGISAAGHVHVAVGAHYHGGFGHYGGFHHYHYGYPHYHFGYGYAHYHHGPHWGFYGYYGPHYYPTVSLSFAPAYYYAPPAYYYSGPVIANYATTPASIVTPANAPELIPPPRAELPRPSESRSFRYDGDRTGARPVERIPPARDLEIPKVPDLPPAPTVPKLGPSPTDMAIATPAASVAKKYSYPAYGEDRLAKPGPRDDKSVLIRRDK